MATPAQEISQFQFEVLLLEQLVLQERETLRTLQEEEERVVRIQFAVDRQLLLCNCQSQHIEIGQFQVRVLRRQEQIYQQRGRQGAQRLMRIRRNLYRGEHRLQRQQGPFEQNLIFLEQLRVAEEQIHHNKLREEQSLANIRLANQQQYRHIQQLQRDRVAALR